MMTTTKIIKKMAQKMSIDIATFPDPRQREAIVTELLHGVVKTSSNLLDSSQLASWRDLTHKEQMRVATSLLVGLEENSFLLADTVIREKTVTHAVKNIRESYFYSSNDVKKCSKSIAIFSLHIFWLVPDRYYVRLYKLITVK